MSWETLRPSFRFLIKAIGVAAAYYGAGKIGLLLAIPPGYATAVWPASGISLAAALLLGNSAGWGVAVGSFLVNVSTSLDASTGPVLLRSLSLAAGIGAGAALQALWGAKLVRRYAGYPNSFLNEGCILRLLLLGGPVSCLFNATWGVALLSLNGLVPSGLLLSNWWTWWVGDAIGVMIFAPILLLWADQSPAARRRQVLVSVPMAVIFAVVVFLFVRSSRSEHARIRSEFEEAAREVAEELQEELDRALESLYAMEGFFAGSERVSRGEFRHFTDRLLSWHPDLQAISWNRLVTDAGRTTFEAELRSEGFPDAVITQRKAGRLVPAARRDVYAPITFVEPLQENRRAIGYDVASSRLRRDALERSLASRRPAATAAVNLVQSEERRRGILVFLPIFKRTEDARPQGYAVTVCVLRRMLEPTLASWQGRHVAVAVSDDEAPSGRRLLYGLVPSSPAFSLDIPVAMADRTWRLRFSALPAYLVSRRSSAAWNLLAGGLFLTGLLGALLLIITGRTLRVESEVAQRTAELRQRQAEAERLLVEVRRANEDLSDFAHVVSHDLKAPLRGISALAHWIAEDNAESMSAEGKERLEMLKGRVRKMSEMIDGILSYSRVARESFDFEDVDLAALVPAVVELLAPPEGIRVEIPAGLPLVRGNPVRLQQVFQNLIGNAVKYMGKPEGCVTVSFGEHAGQWRFTVEDDGPGIEERFFDKIFQVFQTVGLRDRKDSTGVGLSIVKKIVQAAGGKVEVESKVGVGSRFSFTWPRRPVCMGEPAPAAAREDLKV